MPDTYLCPGRLPTTGHRLDAQHADDGSNCYHVPGDCQCARTTSPHTAAHHFGADQPWQKATNGRYYPLAFLVRGGPEPEPVR